jgi:hypothetical protein
MKAGCRQALPAAHGSGRLASHGLRKQADGRGCGMRTLRWIFCIVLVAASSPLVHAQFMSPFAGPGMLYPSCMAMEDGMYFGAMMDPMAYNSMCLMPMMYEPPMLTYYRQRMRQRLPKPGRGHASYTSIGEARMAYAHQGLRALDGMRLGNGLRVGHGGKIGLPDGEYVRPSLDRATGRISLPAGRMAAASGRASGGGFGGGGHEGGSSGGMHAGSMGGGSHGGSSGGGHH